MGVGGLGGGGCVGWVGGGVRACVCVCACVRVGVGGWVGGWVCMIDGVTEKTTTKWTVFIDCRGPTAENDHVLREFWTYLCPCRRGCLHPRIPVDCLLGLKTMLVP